MKTTYPHVCFIVGYTCSGKSLALSLLRSLNYCTLSCDSIVEHLYVSHRGIIQQVTRDIPEAYDGNRICKEQLKFFLQKNKKYIYVLENILYPHIRSFVINFILQKKEEKIIFIEVPKLSHIFNDIYSSIIYIYSPFIVRWFRSCEKRGLKDTFLIFSFSEKIYRYHHYNTVHNICSKKSFKKKMHNFVKKYEQRYFI